MERYYFVILLRQASVKYTTWTMMPNRKGSKITYQFKVCLKQRRSFFFPNGSSRRSFSEGRAKEYTAPQGFFPVSGFETETRFSAASATLDDLSLEVGQTFEYLFDFGDEWWHELAVEAIGAIDAEATYPLIVARRGQSPPQYDAYEE